MKSATEIVIIFFLLRRY